MSQILFVVDVHYPTTKHEYREWLYDLFGHSLAHHLTGHFDNMRRFGFYNDSLDEAIDLANWLRPTEWWCIVEIHVERWQRPNAEDQARELMHAH